MFKPGRLPFLKRRTGQAFPQRRSLNCLNLWTNSPWRSSAIFGIECCIILIWKIFVAGVTNWIHRILDFKQLNSEWAFQGKLLQGMSFSSYDGLNVCPLQTSCWNLIVILTVWGCGPLRGDVLHGLCPHGRTNTVTTGVGLLSEGQFSPLLHVHWG